jgi:uncharacterized delta-60 repeat protein
MRRGMGTFALLAVLALFQAVALAAPGDLDSSFDGDGIAQISASNSSFEAAAVQPDGKLVAAGGVGSGLLVARFGPDGALDPSFSEDGIFVTATARDGSGVAIQPDGRILVAATTPGTAISQGQLAVLRLLGDGTPDGSFSDDGLATALDDRSRGLDVALQGGRVIVAGSTPHPRDAFDRVALARFNADGSPDESFGPGGGRFYDFGRITVANALTIDADGRIVVAGSQRHNLQTTNVLAARFHPNGDQDASFGGNVGIPGVFVRDMARSGAYAAAFDVAVDPEGRVLLAGNATNGLPASSHPQGADALAVRFTAQGALDPSFGSGGIVYLPAAAHKDQYNRPLVPGAYGLALGGSDIILAGYHDELTRKRLALWALRYDGSPDLGFGSGGVRITQIPGSTAQLWALAIAADGTLFGAGDISEDIGTPRGLVAKYSGVGPPPGPPPPPAPPPLPPQAPTCFGLPATIVGTAGRDVRRGTPRRDVIAGLGGADVLVGRGGNDVICGGAGNDRAYGQGGNDRADGGSGADLLAGSFGADLLLGRGGRDRLFGAGGPDRLFGGPAQDVLLGGKGADFLRGGLGRDTLTGGAGSDDSRQ